MKLCYVLPQYNKNSSENFFHIINFLSELGKKVELYVIIEHCDDKPLISNIKKFYVLPESLGTISRFLSLTRIYFDLYKKGVKVFFARSSLTGVFPLIFANRLLNFNRANIIFWSCGQDVVPLSFLPNRRNFKRLISKIIAKVSFLFVNYLATGPELMVDYYHKNYGIPRNKLLTLYNDISLERFYPLSSLEKSKNKLKILSTTKKVMLFVHTFNKSRGIDLIPLIAKKIREKELNAIVLAIGRPGDYSENLNRVIIENSLENYLINFGQVANRDIAKYYQIADLFLMPSRGEGFPRVILEAMATGCPTISFDVGGVSQILPSAQKENLIIPLDNDQKFIDKSIELIIDHNFLKKISAESYKKIDTYRTENVVEMYIKCLSEIE